MKYFTRHYINGYLDEEGHLDEKRYKAVYAAYTQHLAALNLPRTLRALSQVNLHDAYILGVSRQKSNAVLTLRFRSGNLQVGYTDTILRFSQAVISDKSLQTLCDAIRPSNVEVLAEEVDKVGKCYLFRLLLWPKGEISLRFENVAVQYKPVTTRDSK